MEKTTPPMASDAIIDQCAHLVRHFFGYQAVEFAHRQIDIHLRSRDLHQLDVWNRIAALLEEEDTKHANTDRRGGLAVLGGALIGSWSRTALNRIRQVVGLRAA